MPVADAAGSQVGFVGLHPGHGDKAGHVVSSLQATTKVERYFSEEERAYFQSRKNSPQTVAGHFAAKEAFSTSSFISGR